MSNISWSEPTTTRKVFCRAGGRRSYHAKRRLERELRRIQLLKLAEHYGSLTAWGIQSQIAQELEVHRSTISRDFKQLFFKNGSS